MAVKLLAVPSPFFTAVKHTWGYVVSCDAQTFVFQNLFKKKHVAA